MKFIQLFCLCLALIGVQARAQELKVWVSNGTLTADSATITKITVYQTDPSDATYVGFQMQMHVPQGVHIAQRKQGRVMVNDLTLNEYRFEGLSHSLTANMPSSNLLKIACLDMSSNSPFYPDDAEGNVVEELFTIGLIADKSMTNGTYKVTLSGVDFIHKDGTSNSPSEEVSFNLTVTGGKEPVQTEIVYNLSSAGVGTLILPFNSMLPEGLKAYTCTDIQGTSVVTEEQESIISNTALLVTGTPGTYTFRGTCSSVEGSHTSGLLTGFFTETDVNSGYVLQQQSGQVGFYSVKAQTPIKIPAYRCYLNISEAEKAYHISWPDGTDLPVLNADEIAHDEVLYDLSGRKVIKPGNGIYIRNGKKIMIK